MASIDMNKLDKEKDMNFIIFNSAQKFFQEDRPHSVNAFVDYLNRVYGLDYVQRVVKNILVDMAEDGYLKWYTSDKFLLSKSE